MELGEMENWLKSIEAQQDQMSRQLAQLEVVKKAIQAEILQSPDAHKSKLGGAPNVSSKDVKP